MYYISPSFSFRELASTYNRKFKEENRLKAQEFLFNLRVLANYILEPSRALLKCPLIINSAYRCEGLNAAVGGSENSEHLKGLACDFTPLGLSVPVAYGILKDNPLIKYGQLINERDEWIHISLGFPFRTQEKCGQSFRIG